MAETKPTICVERFPNPGAAPPVPPAEPLDVANQQEWFHARFAWNDYVIKCRRYEIARAVDHLQKCDTLSAEQTITMTIGVAILDGTFAELAQIMRVV